MRYRQSNQRRRRSSTTVLVQPLSYKAPPLPLPRVIVNQQKWKEKIASHPMPYYNSKSNNNDVMAENNEEDIGMLMDQPKNEKC